jgi:hypothetical protein
MPHRLSGLAAAPPAGEYVVPRNVGTTTSRGHGYVYG